MLLIFWTLAFMQVNFRLIVLTKEKWFNHLHRAVDIAALSLYVAQYLLTCSVFVLGLRAPGLTPIHQYSSFGGSSDSNNDNRSASEGSTWRNVWSKLRRLLPFMWPRNSPLLQCQLIICFILLAGMRVVNIYVPIYYKKIVDLLSTTGLTLDTWPWCQVLVWVGLKSLQVCSTNQNRVLLLIDQS